MDELKKLKQAWDNSFQEPPKDFDNQSLRDILSRRPSDPVVKLRKSLYLEIGIILLVLPFLVIVMFWLPDPYFILNTLALIVLFVSALAWYWYNLREITLLWRSGQGNLRQSIESTLTLLRFFRKTYFYLNIVLFPLGVYFGYIIGFGLGSGGERITSLLFLENLSIALNILIYIAAGIVIFLGFLLILKLYVRKLYDVHIRKLESIYQELTKNEE